MKACEYMRHPFYQGVNAIVITHLSGVDHHCAIILGYLLVAYNETVTFSLIVIARLSESTGTWPFFYFG